MMYWTQSNKPSVKRERVRLAPPSGGTRSLSLCQRSSSVWPAGQPAGWRAGGLAGWAGRHGSPLALSRQHFQRPQSQAPHFRALRPRPIITATATATAMSRRRRRRRRLRCGRAWRRRRCDERHHAHACGAEEQRQRSRLLLLPPSAIAATVITHATAALDQWQRSSRASRCLP
jgi:hypothetical protein